MSNFCGRTPVAYLYDNLTHLNVQYWKYSPRRIGVNQSIEKKYLRPVRKKYQGRDRHKGVRQKIFFARRIFREDQLGQAGYDLSHFYVLGKIRNPSPRVEKEYRQPASYRLLGFNHNVVCNEPGNLTNFPPNIPW